MLRIEMLPAAHGDAILVEWGKDKPGASLHRMLIDGGPYFVYDEIRARLKQVLGDHRYLDLLVITHIDADHLEGALRLLLDSELGVRFGDVWFNDYSQLKTVPHDALGPQHGEFLGAILDRDALPWNRAFAGQAVVLEKEQQPRRLAPIEGLGITLLSPGPSDLLKLEKAWKKSLDAVDFSPGDRDKALEQLERKAKYAPPSDQLGLKPDTSEANGSSIAFLIEYEGKSALLAGDAFPQTLERALTQLGAPIRLAALKLSHHGSFSSSSKALLEMAPADCYLISTNGRSSARHPDKLTLDLLLAASSGHQPRVVMNYEGENAGPWVEASRSGEIRLDILPGQAVTL